MVPSRFEDIIALIALFRPGPLKQNMHKAFVDQKHGRQKVTYPHPSLQNVLQETYGVIVYQEQAMQVARTMAGYTGLEADELRKAIGKKKADIMLRHREKFIAGAIANDVDRASATRVFDLIETFGGYGFNKSHSTAYALVSYQTAYLKAHYPAEYMAALMTIYMDNQDRLVEYINECRVMGLEVRPPDINVSDGNFTPGEDHVLFGLTAVRNVGSGLVDQMIACRVEDGTFSTFSEFCDRVPPPVLNKKTLESLIKAGAFDSIEGDRSRLLATYEYAVSTAQRRKKERDEGQFTLFGGDGDGEEQIDEVAHVEVAEIPKRQLLAFEKEMLGVYVSDHPLSEYKELIDGHSDIEIAQISPEMDKAQLTIGGIVARVEKKYNKAGKPWAAFALEDFSGSIEVLVFSNKYEKHSELLETDAILLVKGRLDLRDNSRKVLADEVRLLPRSSMRPDCLVLNLEAGRFTEEMVSHIKEVLMEHAGDIPVQLRLHENGGEAQIIRLGDLYSVDTGGDLIARLKSLLGESAVTLQYPI
jgi:DNA polymerase-3 subunit alpha